MCWPTRCFPRMRSHTDIRLGPGDLVDSNGSLSDRVGHRTLLILMRSWLILCVRSGARENSWENFKVELDKELGRVFCKSANRCINEIRKSQHCNI